MLVYKHQLDNPVQPAGQSIGQTGPVKNGGTQYLGKATSKSASTGKFDHRDNSRNHHHSTGLEVRALARYQLPTQITEFLKPNISRRLFQKRIPQTKPL
ncbi:hypothetical protein PCANC_09589 [Puccinia coronata f. sp. avenae]|uniref:Uncharacterized protein n=1 Tax=Puccinia coronata f. sp. avenae TaxID=200324 RepID=A0A2N5V9S0_9BASI|nr:hypothetical protein PCANC_09589 [Puccinia coronata f. sp. avenae]